MTSYDTLVIKDGVIEGELADGGVVTIPDKAWIDVDENTLEGNWEQVTRTVVKDIIEDRHLKTIFQSGETLSVEYDRFLDVLTDSSIVEHEDPETERQRADLLLEHLVREGVYKRRGQEVVVLDNLDSSSKEFTKLNWSVLFSHMNLEIDSVVQSAESQRETVVETTEDEPQAQFAEDIQQMRQVNSRISKFEQQLRAKAIRDITDMTEAQEKIQHIQEFANNVLMGETNEQNADGSKSGPATDESNEVIETNQMFRDNSQEKL